MYPHSFLWHYLWLAPHVLQILIAVFMVRRHLVGKFPFFFTYTIFQIVEEGTLFILDHHPKVSGIQYWQAYWVGLLIAIAFRLAVIREIYSNALREYPGFRQLGRILFRVATTALIFIAIVIIARAPDDGTIPLLAPLPKVELAASVVQCGLVLLLLGFVSYAGLAWRGFGHGIAVGLGIFSSVQLATQTMRVWTGPVAGFAFDLVTMATYHCCVVIWLVYLLSPEMTARRLKQMPENNLEEWNAELQRLLLQ
jgi:hypothetical protein